MSANRYRLNAWDHCIPASRIQIDTAWRSRVFFIPLWLGMQPRWTGDCQRSGLLWPTRRSLSSLRPHLSIHALAIHIEHSSPAQPRSAQQRTPKSRAASRTSQQRFTFEARLCASRRIRPCAYAILRRYCSQSAISYSQLSRRYRSSQSRSMRAPAVRSTRLDLAPSRSCSRLSRYCQFNQPALNPPRWSSRQL